MKNTILSVVLLFMLTGSIQAGVMLVSSNPSGTPLTMTAGQTSGLMAVTIISDNPPNDVIAGWILQLEIIPNTGATGTLTFQDPGTGTPPNPPNYIFGSNGLGIAATNSGNVLDANDFFDPNIGVGATVPGVPGANLLQLDFLASSNASGVFGIYADQGAANTQWTDSSFTTQFFTNVPDGTGTVLIGEVLVTQESGTQAVPAPPSLTLLCIGSATLASWNWWRKRKLAVAWTHAPLEL